MARYLIGTLFFLYGAVLVKMGLNLIDVPRNPIFISFISFCIGVVIGIAIFKGLDSL